MAAEGGNELLPTARRKRYREVVGKEDWTDRGGCVSRMWQTPDHIVFRCGKVRRVKDERVDLMEAFFAGVHRQI